MKIKPREWTYTNLSRPSHCAFHRVSFYLLGAQHAAELSSCWWWTTGFTAHQIESQLGSCPLSQNYLCGWNIPHHCMKLVEPCWNHPEVVSFFKHLDTQKSLENRTEHSWTMLEQTQPTSTDDLSCLDAGPGRHRHPGLAMKIPLGSHNSVSFNMEMYVFTKHSPSFLGFNMFQPRSWYDS